MISTFTTRRWDCCELWLMTDYCYNDVITGIHVHKACVETCVSWTSPSGHPCAAFIRHGLQSVLTVYDIVRLQNRPLPMFAASSMVTVLSNADIVAVVVDSAAVVVPSSLLSVATFSSDDVTAGVVVDAPAPVTVWIVGSPDRHTAASSHVNVPVLCIIDARGRLSLQTVLLSCLYDTTQFTRPHWRQNICQLNIVVEVDCRPFTVTEHSYRPGQKSHFRLLLWSQR